MYSYHGQYSLYGLAVWLHTASTSQRRPLAQRLWCSNHCSKRPWQLRQPHQLHKYCIGNNIGMVSSSFLDTVDRDGSFFSQLVISSVLATTETMRWLKSTLALLNLLNWMCDSPVHFLCSQMLQSTLPSSDFEITCLLGLHRISALASANSKFGHFSQIRPNSASAKFGFGQISGRIWQTPMQLQCVQLVT